MIYNFPLFYYLYYLIILTIIFVSTLFNFSLLNQRRKIIFFWKKYKKAPQITSCLQFSPQCSKSNQVAPKLLKCNKNATYFFVFL